MKNQYSSRSWHKRFQQQAAWTQSLRTHLYDRAGLADAKRILDVGCGTGVLEAELTSLTRAMLVGVDINPEHLQRALHIASAARLIQANGLDLPFPGACFELSLCHFLLLWVADPILILREMIRVTQPGGAVLVIAEPDYGGRIDYPRELSSLGEWQQTSLRAQGADPLIGRRLRALLLQAGLTHIETGVLGGQWYGISDQSEWEAEWDMLENDLARLDSHIVNQDILQNLKEKDAHAYLAGERVLFVPTFYGWGRVPLPG